MLQRWLKIPTTLHWRLESINLRRPINCDFQVIWTRGATTGRTDLIRPDEKGILHFDCDFEAPCTMFTSKTEAKVRPKLVKLLLRRFLSAQQSAVIGKLDIDVADYLNEPEGQSVHLEMESGRSVPPVFCAYFQFVGPGEATDADADQNTPSFLDDVGPPLALDEWDVSDDAERPGKSKKGKKGKHKSDAASETPDEPKPKKISKTVSDLPNTSEIPIGEPHHRHRSPGESHKKSEPSHHKKRSDPVEEQETTEQSSRHKMRSHTEEEQAPPEQPSRHKKRPPAEEEQAQPSRHKKRSRAADDAAEEPSPPPSPPQEPPPSVEPEPPAVEERPEVLAANLALLRRVLARIWPVPERPVYMDGARLYKFPGAVFPIVATLLHLHIFDPSVVGGSSYAQLVDAFFEGFERAPLSEFSSAEEKLVTTLLLTVLVGSMSDNPTNAVRRLREFRQRLENLLIELIDALLTQCMSLFEPVVNRLSTAQFQITGLVEDFSQVLDSVVAKFSFPAPVTKFVLARLADLLDVKFANKILMNPSRFTCLNGVTWNSCLSALEISDDLQFPRVRQVVSVMVMATALVKPGSAKDVSAGVCPDLNPKIVFYILKNIVADLAIPDPIDASQFGAVFGIEQVDGIPPLQAPPCQRFDWIGEQINIALWNKGKYPPAVLQEFPHLRDLAQA